MYDDFRPKRAVKPALELKSTIPQTNSPEPFLTPEQVSEQDTPVLRHAAPAAAKPRGSGHHWFNLPWPPNREEIWLASLVLIMAIFGCFGFIKMHHVSVAPVTVIKHAEKAAVVQPATVPSTLSGLPVAPDVNQRPVIGAMIENSLDARPQAGLSQAGVVFEAVAEGGVTRFLALFQDQQPTTIGPIRSARPYYVQWNMGFDAAYAHVGGSSDALNDIKSWNVKDLNQFYNASAYHRVSSRPSPHNVYSSVTDLASLASQKKFSSSFSGFSRKTASPSATPTASSIDLSLSGSIYNPHYSYDAASNSYLRSEGGSPQTDANTGKQLAPNVVIAMVVPMARGALDSSGAYYSDYNVIGSGTAYVFQDGGVTSGTWSKTSNDAQISFSDASGQVLKLNPGQTWISAVTSTAKVSYK